jgi:hypothetical protein
VAPEAPWSDGIVTANHEVLFGLGLETDVDQVSEILEHARSLTTLVSTS